MKVELLGELSGTRDGQAWPPRGSIVELPDDEAAQLCANRMARPVVTEMVTMGGESVATAVTVDDVEQRGPLTTKNGPAKRRVPTDAT